MREILFRGKLKSNGEWSFGNLNVSLRGTVIITPDETSIGKYGQVIPETVGQYTGLTDNNGKKIFEGDICAIVGEEKEIIKDDIFVVSWKENCGFNLYTCFDYEIIGNIHDNPELLKEAEQE